MPRGRGQSGRRGRRPLPGLIIPERTARYRRERSAVALWSLQISVRSTNAKITSHMVGAGAHDSPCQTHGILVRLTNAQITSYPNVPRGVHNRVVEGADPYRGLIMPERISNTPTIGSSNNPSSLYTREPFTQILRSPFVCSSSSAITFLEPRHYGVVFGLQKVRVLEEHTDCVFILIKVALVRITSQRAHPSGGRGSRCPFH